MSAFDSWLLTSLGFLVFVIGGVVKWAFGIQAKVDSLVRHEKVNSEAQARVWEEERRERREMRDALLKAGIINGKHRE